MEIHILIRTTEPLAGTATREGEAPLEFHGWLELLKTLSTLVEAEDRTARGEVAASQDLSRSEGRGSGQADEKAVDDGALQV